MATIRKPFQGVLNIVHFNWHFFVIATAVVLVLIFTARVVIVPFSFLLDAVAVGMVFTTFISLAVSYYVYDLSELYTLNWIREIQE